MSSSSARESLPDALWKRSSFCAADGCVEVAVRPDAIGVRDSKDGASPVLSFNRQEWEAFVLGVKRGEFDLI